jgi:SAM-dependent methyltransferase
MDQVSVNNALWRGDDHVGVYANRVLAPVEVVILLRYRDELAGRVIEVGCGAGRVLGYLAELSSDANGIDLSPAMVDYCHRAYPNADVQVGDVIELRSMFEQPFDVIVAANSLIDVFDDERRAAVLAEMHRCLVPGGLLIFSSHNLAFLSRGADASSPGRRWGGIAAVGGKLVHKSPAEVAAAVRRLPSAARNRRRLAPLQRATADYAIVNDDTFGYALLHYYVRRDAQERQLAEAGFDLVECLDPDGRQVPRGHDGDGPWLHYVARRRRSSEH